MDCFLQLFMHDRRAFLAALVGAAVVSGSYLNDRSMDGPPQIEGRIIGDMHTHPSNRENLEVITENLSWGITALTSKNGNPNILTYEQALGLPSARGIEKKEIDKGIFALLEVNGQIGYFLKAQEIFADHHIIALGCRKKLPSYIDARKAVEEIHRHGGIAILPHPHLLLHGLGSMTIPYIVDRESKEYEKIVELCHMVDEVETFNAYCVNLLGGAGFMDSANEKARMLAYGYKHKGMAVSDAHYRWEQVKIAGVHFPSEKLSFEALRHHIKTGNFIPHETYTSRLSFLKSYIEMVYR